MSGLLDAEPYRCEQCTAAGLHTGKGCTGLRGLRPMEKLADVLARDPESGPSAVAGVEPTYPEGWITIATEASTLGIDSIRESLADLPQYEAEPITHCLRLLAFDPATNGWLSLYSQIKSGLVAPPKWTPPAYSRMMGAIMGAVSSYERALYKKSKPNE